MLEVVRSLFFEKVDDFDALHRRKKKTKTKRVGGGEKDDDDDDFCCFWVLGRVVVVSAGGRVVFGGGWWWVQSQNWVFHVSAWTENGRALLSVVFLQHRLQRVQQEHAERLPVPVVDFHLAVSRDVDLDARRLGDWDSRETESVENVSDCRFTGGVFPHGRTRLGVRVVFKDGGVVYARD